MLENLEKNKTLDGIQYYLDGDSVVLSFKGKLFSFRPLNTQSLIGNNYPEDYYDKLFERILKGEQVKASDFIVEVINNNMKKQEIQTNSSKYRNIFTVAKEKDLSVLRLLRIKFLAQKLLLNRMKDAAKKINSK